MRGPNIKGSLTPEEYKEYRKVYMREYARKNKERLKAAKDKWSNDNPDKAKENKKRSEVRITYNVSLEEYNKCMSTSDKCMICGSTHRLVYDHCHLTGDFRGVLCNKCNRGLGYLGDTEDALHKAYMYLRKKYA